MAQQRKSELVPGTLEMLILRSLLRGPRHGYAIAEHILRTTDSVLQVEEGSLYPALHRLERAKVVDSEWRPSENNRRAKFYRLSQQGLARLKSDTARWESVVAAIGKVLSARSIPGRA